MLHDSHKIAGGEHELQVDYIDPLITRITDTAPPLRDCLSSEVVLVFERCGLTRLNYLFIVS